MNKDKRIKQLEWHVRLLQESIAILVDDEPLGIEYGWLSESEMRSAYASFVMSKWPSRYAEKMIHRNIGNQALCLILMLGGRG